MLFNFQSFGLGFVTGFATGMVARELTSVTTTALKPLARAVVKTSVLAYDRARESLAHMAEAVEDIVAEVRSETAAAPVVAKAAAGGTKKATSPKKAAAVTGTAP